MKQSISGWLYIYIYISVGVWKGKFWPGHSYASQYATWIDILCLWCIPFFFSNKTNCRLWRSCFFISSYLREKPSVLSRIGRSNALLMIFDFRLVEPQLIGRNTIGYENSTTRDVSELPRKLYSYQWHSSFKYSRLVYMLRSCYEAVAVIPDIY